MAEDFKAAAARRALELVRPGMLLGIGSGSTARFFIAGLSGRDVRCVASSRVSAEQARALGLEVLEEPPAELDLAVDGADEIDPSLNLIKGRGGALFREKLVALAARRLVIVADDSKLVEQLGVGVLPVEVLPFLWPDTARRLESFGAWQLRGGLETPYVTDNGNYILDLSIAGGVSDPAGLGSALKSVTGVCEHGLFTRLAAAAIVAGPAGIRVLGSLD